jgi:hypothetical protein
MPDSRNRPICQSCARPMTLELQPGGKLPRTFQCIGCERPDPLKTMGTRGWLKGELSKGE